MEEEIEQEEIRVLTDPFEITKLYNDLLQSAMSEISLIVSTANALLRQHNIGIMGQMKIAAEQRNVQVNLAVPNFEKQKVAKSISESLQELEELPAMSRNIHVRNYQQSINQTSKINSTILLVDRQFSLVIDSKDDLKENFMDAIGFATYSSSSSRTQSYNFIFDTIWMQAELYNQLEMRTIELEKLNTMQNEFINMAAHELRTPTQAILGYSEMLAQSESKIRIKDYENAIARNAQRLHFLASDILDVARIESQMFRLNKSYFDLTEEIDSVVKAVKDRPDWVDISRRVMVILDISESISIFGDKQRIHEVIFNLVNNALKFTEEGTIMIRVEKNIQTKDAIITVADTGTGIDKEILPRIFSKFVSKSKSTGLGLFIAKAIIEAHGGHIEAYNNIDGNGAVFKFTLNTTTNG